MIDLLDTLRQLTETPGPSGFEERVAAVIADLWRPLVDEITMDRVGSLSALVRGSGVEPRPRILLAAHLDEIGLIVSEVREYRGSGFLRVTDIGYFFASLLPLRVLDVIRERLSPPKAPDGTGLSRYEGGAVITPLLAAMLKADAFGSLLLRRAGISLPGLSNYAICRTSA